MRICFQAWLRVCVKLEIQRLSVCVFWKWSLIQPCLFHGRHLGDALIQRWLISSIQHSSWALKALLKVLGFELTLNLLISSPTSSRMMGVGDHRQGWPVRVGQKCVHICNPSYSRSNIFKVSMLCMLLRLHVPTKSKKKVLLHSWQELWPIRRHPRMRKLADRGYVIAKQVLCSGNWWETSKSETLLRWFKIVDLDSLELEVQRSNQNPYPFHVDTSAKCNHHLPHSLYEVKFHQFAGKYHTTSLFLLIAVMTSLISYSHSDKLLWY